MLIVCRHLFICAYLLSYFLNGARTPEITVRCAPKLPMIGVWICVYRSVESKMYVNTHERFQIVSADEH